MQKILMLIFVALFCIACGHQKDAKEFEALLEASTGQQYSVAKLHTVTGKYVVYKNDTTGEYVAYNMDKFDRKNMTSMDQFLAVATKGVDIVNNLDKKSEWINSGYWEDEYESYTYYEDVYDEDCDCYYTESWTETVYVGSYWVDTSHWETFYYGGGFKFDNTSSQSKDLEMISAVKEAVAEKFLAHKFSSEFSLSDNRATELAKLATRYQKLESVRELTATEKDKFALDALGVSFSQVESAMKKKTEGKEDNYEDLLKTAAQVNKTTPEQIGKFFDEYINEVGE